jgi:ribosomal protein S2
LAGKITANTKIQNTPDYLFIPDIAEDLIIMQEATRKKIVIIGIVSTDSQYVIDIPLLGNNKDFKIITQLIKFILQLLLIKRDSIVDSKRRYKTQLNHFYITPARK